MTDSIPRSLVDHLIEIGRTESFGELEHIGNEFPSARRGGFMRTVHDTWARIAESLSEDELIWLIKALTRLEHYPNFKAGSVSPVIWLFRCLPSASERVELVNWIFR